MRDQGEKKPGPIEDLRVEAPRLGENITVRRFACSSLASSPEASR